MRIFAINAFYVKIQYTRYTKPTACYLHEYFKKLSRENERKTPHRSHGKTEFHAFQALQLQRNTKRTITSGNISGQET